MEVIIPDWGPKLSCCSSRHQEGSVQVQVTKLPQLDCSGNSLSKSRRDLTCLNSLWIFRAHSDPGSSSQQDFILAGTAQRGFHHRCNNHGEGELHKEKLDWKHFLRYFQILTFSWWLRWQHKSLA